MPMMTQFGGPAILIATPQLHDKNFHKAVILLAEHNDEGSMGFILNRPSEQPVRDMVTMADRDIPAHLGAWFGGPIGQEQGIVLTTEEADPSDTEITKGIYLSSSAEAMNQLVDHSVIARTRRLTGTPVDAEEMAYFHPYRFIVGYSGWGAGQLTEEIRHGAWVVLPLHPGLIFNTPWQQMWDEAMMHLGIDGHALTSSPTQYMN